MSPKTIIPQYLYKDRTIHKCLQTETSQYSLVLVRFPVVTVGTRYVRLGAATVFATIAANAFMRFRRFATLTVIAVTLALFVVVLER